MWTTSCITLALAASATAWQTDRSARDSHFMGGWAPTTTWKAAVGGDWNEYGGWNGNPPCGPDVVEFKSFDAVVGGASHTAGSKKELYTVTTKASSGKHPLEKLILGPGSSIELGLGSELDFENGVTTYDTVVCQGKTNPPTATPTFRPTTADPTPAPTIAPTGEPTPEPTGQPTVQPTFSPTLNPDSEDVMFPEMTLEFPGVDVSQMSLSDKFKTGKEIKSAVAHSGGIAEQLIIQTMIEAGRTARRFRRQDANATAAAGSGDAAPAETTAADTSATSAPVAEPTPPPTADPAGPSMRVTLTFHNQVRQSEVDAVREKTETAMADGTFGKADGTPILTYRRRVAQNLPGGGEVVSSGHSVARPLDAVPTPMPTLLVVEEVLDTSAGEDAAATRDDTLSEERKALETDAETIATFGADDEDAVNEIKSTLTRYKAELIDEIEERAFRIGIIKNLVTTIETDYSTAYLADVSCDPDCRNGEPQQLQAVTVQRRKLKARLLAEEGTQATAQQAVVESEYKIALANKNLCTVQKSLSGSVCDTVDADIQTVTAQRNDQLAALQTQLADLAQKLEASLQQCKAEDAELAAVGRSADCQEIEERLATTKKQVTDSEALATPPGKSRETSPDEQAAKVKAAEEELTVAKQDLTTATEALTKCLADNDQDESACVAEKNDVKAKEDTVKAKELNVSTVKAAGANTANTGAAASDGGDDGPPILIIGAAVVVLILITLVVVVAKSGGGGGGGGGRVRNDAPHGSSVDARTFDNPMYDQPVEQPDAGQAYVDAAEKLEEGGGGAAPAVADGYLNVEPEPEPEADGLYDEPVMHEEDFGTGDPDDESDDDDESEEDTSDDE